MATNAVNAANVTKYTAGGSGDNYIPDGFIKTTEKIWMDNYTITGNITLTNTTIAIAVLPPNKKLIGVEVVIATSISQSSGTIGLGWASDADAANWGALITETSVTHNNTVSTLQFPSLGIVQNLNAGNGLPKISGFQAVTAGTQTTVALKLNNWTMSTGTIKTIVRYA